MANASMHQIASPGQSSANGLSVLIQFVFRPFSRADSFHISSISCICSVNRLTYPFYQVQFFMLRFNIKYQLRNFNLTTSCITFHFSECSLTLHIFTSHLSSTTTRYKDDCLIDTHIDIYKYNQGRIILDSLHGGALMMTVQSQR